jgi:hypothetical protein
MVSIEEKDELTCVSNHDYMLHISASAADGQNLRIHSGDQLVHGISLPENGSYMEVGGLAGESLKVSLIQVGDQEGFGIAVVTLSTAEGATASCTLS